MKIPRLPRCFAALALALFAVQPVHAGPKDNTAAGSELWITGDIFTKNEILLFRADRPVQGNPTGAVVMLGTSKALAQSMFPVLMKAAERKMRVRLYGVLQPCNAVPPGHEKESLPKVQFIVWKIHLPSDPDVLPAGTAIISDGKGTWKKDDQ